VGLEVGEVTMGAYSVPLFPGRIALAIGATIFIGQYLIDLVKNFVILVSHIETTDKISQEPENVI
jgi:hypothetical protein